MLNIEELVEFQTLATLLNDQFVYHRLDKKDSKTLDIMIKRYGELIDKITKQYELPNLVKHPIQD